MSIKVKVSTTTVKTHKIEIDRVELVRLLHTQSNVTIPNNAEIFVEDNNHDDLDIDSNRPITIRWMEHGAETKEV